MTLYKFIIYSGRLALGFILASFLCGIIGGNFNMHRALGIAALGFSLLHALLIAYKNFKLRRVK